MPCKECLTPCPEHGQTYCSTCHDHAGECSCGGCSEPATSRFARVVRGIVIERRAFCDLHATSPDFGWLRAGLAWEKNSFKLKVSFLLTSELDVLN